METEIQYDIEIMGDLSFPPMLTTWHTSEEGVFPNPKEEVSDQKQAFQILMNMDLLNL